MKSSLKCWGFFFVLGNNCLFYALFFVTLTISTTALSVLIRGRGLYSRGDFEYLCICSGHKLLVEILNTSRKLPVQLGSAHAI